MTVQRCEFCGRGPEALREGGLRGCVILGYAPDGSPMPYHRLCAEQAEAA